ncbi:MAG: OmpA family protein [Burkholderiaceae bacterium]
MPKLDSSLAALEAFQPSPIPQPPRAKATGRRYSRWHTETNMPAEEEGWLLTYLDVITLMLVMVVVMLAVAGPPGDGATTTTEPLPDPLATSAPATVQPPSLVPPLPVTSASAQNAPPAPSGIQTHSEVPQAPAEEAWASLQLDQIGENVAITPGQDSVRFRISNELLFASGEANLLHGGHAVLDKLLPSLLADPHLRLVVEGHTDSIPIQTARYPSNWELSTGRAASVARYLIEHGVAPQRVQASGYADTRPLGSKDNPVDRAANRRVELILEKVKPGA